MRHVIVNQPLEVFAQNSYAKKLFSKISQNSQENINSGISLIVFLQISENF